MENIELLPFNQLMQKLTDIDGEAFSNQQGVHSYIYEFGIEMPVELQVLVDEWGNVQLGSTPPLYDVDTTFKPSYHQIRFTAVKYEPHGNGE